MTPKNSKSIQSIPNEEIRGRMAFENPWWTTGHIADYVRGWAARAYLPPFLGMVGEKEPNRAIVLMGPRRVGKTVMLHHAIESLISNGMAKDRICYVSVDAPIYTGLSLESLLRHYFAIAAIKEPKDCVVIFDEIQYLRDWEIHLKKLVDDYREIKFIASGSAAAALRLKSLESGAGRFSNFLLPPLTFHEYLSLTGKDAELIDTERKSILGADFFQARDVGALNSEFVNYLNFGGYPEALFSEQVRSDPGRFIKSDIIDKVLLRDLPSLYGIEDIQELNRLFMTLAYNTGCEVSLETLSQGSGVAKNTIKRYLEYLEAAFLIRIMHRVNRSAKVFKRANFFKVYLTNPSMRCALFQPVTADQPAMGNLAETAVISQWLHSRGMDKIWYARWNGGEIDLVHQNGEKINWAAEVKWSDRFLEHPEELTSALHFAKTNNMHELIITTISGTGERTLGGLKLGFTPTAAYCYTIGRNTVWAKNLGF